MVFWVILSLILAGYSFLRLGIDRLKRLKMDFLCGLFRDFANYTFWTTCHKLKGVSNRLFVNFLCSQRLLMLLFYQQCITITSLSWITSFCIPFFVKSHTKSDETKNTSLGWSIPDLIFRNPLVVFLLRTNRDRKTRVFDQIWLKKWGPGPT